MDLFGGDPGNERFITVTPLWSDGSSDHKVCMKVKIPGTSKKAPLSHRGFSDWACRLHCHATGCARRHAYDFLSRSEYQLPHGGEGLVIIAIFQGNDPVIAAIVVRPKMIPSGHRMAHRQMPIMDFGAGRGAGLTETEGTHDAIGRRQNHGFCLCGSGRTPADGVAGTLRTTSCLRRVTRRTASTKCERRERRVQVGMGDPCRYFKCTFQSSYFRRTQCIELVKKSVPERIRGPSQNLFQRFTQARQCKAASPSWARKRSPVAPQASHARGASPPAR